MATIYSLEESVKELKAENDKLRGLLAKGSGDCVYCGLPAADISKCPSGFPGCARMDDIVNAPESEFHTLLTAASHALRSYQYGNSATDLAKEMADRIDKEIANGRQPKNSV